MKRKITDDCTKCGTSKVYVLDENPIVGEDGSKVGWKSADHRITIMKCPNCKVKLYAFENVK